MIKFGVINYIFGAPGSGKTTVLAKIYKQYSNRKLLKVKFIQIFL